MPGGGHRGTVPPRRASRRRPDAGFTLIEVTVAMAVLAVVMSIFTGAMLQLYRAIGTNEAMATAQQQLNQAFQRLEKEIRYAAGITDPGTAGSNSHLVEYLTGADCHQLRLHRETAQKPWQLQHRAWVKGSGPPTGVGYHVLASHVSSIQPFTLIAADGTVTFQRLRVQLTAGSATRMDVTFPALNSTGAAAAGAGTCKAEGR